MIHEVTGDILLTRAQVIAHGVGPNDHFDKGLALALRERYPAMARDFRHHARQTHPKPGELWTWGGFGVRIVALMTREGEAGHAGHPGRSTVPMVNHCLRALRHEVEKEKFASLALPRLATGMGGLDWADVRPLIDTHLGDLDIPIIVYATYHAGQQADEPGLT